MNMLNIYWTIAEDVKVDHNTATAILAAHGFTPDMIPAPTEKKAIRRGLDELHDRRGNANHRRVVEKIRETPDKVVFGVLKCNVYTNIEQSAYKQDTKVTLEKDTGRIIAEGTLADTAYAAINTHQSVCNDADVRMMLLNFIRKIGGVSKRPSGGIYLVPALYADKVNDMKAVLKEMTGANVSLYTERVFDGEEEYKNMAVSVFDDISNRIALTVKAVENITKQACRIKGHQEDVAQYKELVEMYKTVLGKQDELDNLSAMLVDAESKIAGVIAKIG